MRIKLCLFLTAMCLFAVTASGARAEISDNELYLGGGAVPKTKSKVTVGLSFSESISPVTLQPDFDLGGLIIFTNTKTKKDVDCKVRGRYEPLNHILTGSCTYLDVNGK